MEWPGRRIRYPKRRFPDRLDDKSGAHPKALIRSHFFVTELKKVFYSDC